ncbi:MAG TPA: transglycosylase SLT domain-containing protein, partial [Gemmataceae bacterium]|nr:transglycosylase SLT domain-containing protein [Gemmataceae bacterium]
AKARVQEAELGTQQRMQERMRTFQEGGGVGAPASAPTSTTARQGTGPTNLDTAVTEATKLYPQVRPDLVHGIIRHESNYDVNALSPKGALGPMQLMPGTAQDMGVDPKDPTQNVRGGTRYFAQLLTKYNGNEALALAAYNWGPGNVDKVGGDFTKMPAETQAYVKNVLASAAPGGQRGPADTRIQVAGPGAPSQDQAQLTRLNQQIAAMDQFLAANIGSGRERTKGMVNEVQQERQRLIQEREKLLETPRTVERERQLQPLKLAQQRAGAEVQLEAKMNEPIGTDNARKLDLPPSTKWKDVPKDRMPKEDPSAPERQAFSDMRASVAGIDRLMAALDKPEIARMVGTLWSEPEASVTRKLGAYLATLSPEQRQFAATLAGEVMEIRHRLAGANQTPSETAAMAPMLPTPDDTDPATLRAKLTALREAMMRRHDAKREDLEGMGFRVPAKLARPAEPPKPGAKAQEALDILKPQGGS